MNIYVHVTLTFKCSVKGASSNELKWVKSIKIFEPHEQFITLAIHTLFFHMNDLLPSLYMYTLFYPHEQTITLAMYTLFFNQQHLLASFIIHSFTAAAIATITFNTLSLNSSNCYPHLQYPLFPHTNDSYHRQNWLNYHIFF